MKKYLLILFIFCSCNYVPFKTRMESWIGASKHSLILSWGAPSYTSSDGNGGEVLTYSTDRTNHYPTNYGGVISRTVSEYREFYINSNGNIYSVRWGRR